MGLFSRFCRLVAPGRYSPPILQTSFHSSAVTGCTERREYFTSAMAASFLSALIAAMVTATGDPCSRTLQIYMDGRSRFDFVMQPNGTVNVNSRVYRGPAIRCRVQFRPVAGFSDPQEPSTMTFLFVRTASGMYAPIQIEMPTDGVGIVRLEARRMSFNGQRL